MAPADLRSKIREASRLMYNQREATEESLQQHNQLQTPPNGSNHLITPPTSVSQFQRSRIPSGSYHAGQEYYVHAASPQAKEVRWFNNTDPATDATGITTSDEDAFVTPDRLRTDLPHSAYIRSNRDGLDYYSRPRASAATHNPLNSGISNVNHHLHSSVLAHDPKDGTSGYGQFGQNPVGNNYASSYSSLDVRNQRPRLDPSHAASHDSLHVVTPVGIHDHRTSFDANSNAPETLGTVKKGDSSRYRRHFDKNTAMDYLRPGLNRVKNIDSWPAWLESPTAQDQVVQELFDAVYSLEMAQDGPNGGWTESIPYKSIAEGKTDSKEIEAYCWRLFVNVRDIHINGSCCTREKPPRVTMAVKNELREMFGVTIDSNEDIKTHVVQRFENIKYVLRRSKIFLNDLEDEAKSKMLALAPLGMLSKKGVYRANNMQKQARLKEQRELKKAVEVATRDAVVERSEESSRPTSDQGYTSGVQRGAKKRSREDDDDDLFEASKKRARNSVITQQTETTDRPSYGARPPRFSSTSPRPMANGAATRRYIDYPSSRKLNNSSGTDSCNEERSPQINGYDSSPLAQYGHGAFTKAQNAITPATDLLHAPTDETLKVQSTSQAFRSDDPAGMISHSGHFGPDTSGGDPQSGLFSPPLPSPPQEQQEQIQFQNDFGQVGQNSSRSDQWIGSLDGNNLPDDDGFLDNNALIEWDWENNGFIS